MQNRLWRSSAKWSALLSIVGVLANSSSAEAILPATQEQLLCLSSYIFAGRVTAAVGEFPAKPREITSNLPPTPVRLSVTVLDIVGVAAAPRLELSAGDTMELMTALGPSFDFDGGFTIYGPGGTKVRQETPWVSAELVQAFLAGKTFIFSIETNRPGRTRYETRIYRLDERGWILKTMAQARGRTDCPVAR